LSGVEELRRRVVEGPIVWTMLSLAAPMVAARLLASIQESVDAVFLGRVSAADLAAPVAVWPLLMVFNGLSFAVTTAAVSMVSQLVGAGRFGEAEEAAGRLMGLMLILAVAGALAVALAAPPVFRLLGLPPGVYELSVAYAVVDALGLPFMFTLLFFNATRSSLGDTRTPFKLSSLSSLLNLALDPPLIFGLGPIPGLGAVGAALATTISRSVAGGVALYLLLTGRGGLRVRPRLPDGDTLRYVASTGGPIAGQQLLVSTGFLVMMGIVARLGEAVMAAYNLGLALIHVIQTATWGFSSATATMVGQALGAGLVGRARRVALTGIALVSGLLAAGSAALYIAADTLVALLTDIPEVAEVSVEMIRLLAPGVPFLGAFFASMGVARGSGWTLVMSLLNIARLWLVRIPLAALLALHLGWGPKGVWIAMTLSNVAAGILAVAWVLKGSWAKPRVKPPAGAAGEARSQEENTLETRPPLRGDTRGGR